jgi:hypothetical protein
MAAWQFGPLAMFGYDLIVADPPWADPNKIIAAVRRGHQVLDHSG